MSKKNEKRTELEDYILDCFKNNISGAVVTLPGFGISHELMEFSIKNKFTYLSSLEQKPGQRNIVDININLDQSCVEDFEKYYIDHREIKPRRVYILIINSPYLLYTEIFKNKSFVTHLHLYHYFKSRSLDEVKDILHTWGYKFDYKDVNRLYKLSGGITRMLKYFCTYPEKIKKEVKDLVMDSVFVNLISPTIKEIVRSTEEDLEKLGIKKDGKYISNLIQEILNDVSFVSKFLDVQITIGHDGGFKENGISSCDKLSEFESELLKEIMQDSFITRDRIAYIKWGESFSDFFSDEAINKSISRLNSKLKFHKIINVRGRGYSMTRM